MSSDDLTSPVRPRGPVHADEPTESDLDAPVRTRGPIRFGSSVPETGAVRTAAISRGLAPTLWELVATVDDLLSACRIATGAMPLTILIDKADTAASQDFSRMLYPKLLDYDAFWLVGLGDTVTAPLYVEGTVALDVTQPDDQRIYSNLVCDIVFVPLPTDDALDFMPWRRRTSAFVVDARTSNVEAMMDRGRRMGLVMYMWLGAEVLKH